MSLVWLQHTSLSVSRSEKGTGWSSRSLGARCRNSIALCSDEQPHIGNYRLLKTIGKGNFAKVKLARHILTGREVGLIKTLTHGKGLHHKSGALRSHSRAGRVLWAPPQLGFAGWSMSSRHLLLAFLSSWNGCTSHSRKQHFCVCMNMNTLLFVVASAQHC